MPDDPLPGTLPRPEPGGNITILASESVELSGSSADGQFFSGLFTNTEGSKAAGDLRITTGRLLARDGAQVSADTFGDGKGGTLSVTADAIELVGESANGQFSSGLFTRALSKGDAGDLKITTGQLSVQDGAQVSATTFGEGDAGNVGILARDGIFFDGVSSNGFPSGAFSRVDNAAVGEGGTININTGVFSVTNGAGVSVSSEGVGNAGNLMINASRSIQMNNQASLTAESVSGGGDIELQAGDFLLVRRNSLISTKVEGARSGGNVGLDADFLVVLGNSAIRSDAIKGPGGDIQINAQGIFLSPDSEIVSNGISVVGESNSNLRLVALPEEVVDVSGLVVQKCPAGGGAGKRAASKFVVTGRGGLPPNPSDPPSSDVVLANWITLDPEIEEKRSSLAPTTNQATSYTPAPMVEAQGWIRGSGGEIVLTAQVPVATSYSPGLAQGSCSGPRHEAN